MLYLSIFSALIPLVIGWSKKKSILWLYILIAFLTDGLAYLFNHVLIYHQLFHTFKLEYHWLFNLFLVTEFIAISYYYINRIFSKKILFICTSLTGTLLFLLHTTFIAEDKWLKLNSSASSVFMLYYLVLSIIGFVHLLKEKKTPFLEHSMLFWVNTAILIYTAGNFFIFLLRENAQAADPKAMVAIWNHIFRSLNILKNILLGIALSKKEET